MRIGVGVERDGATAAAARDLLRGAGIGGGGLIRALGKGVGLAPGSWRSWRVSVCLRANTRACPHAGLPACCHNQAESARISPAALPFGRQNAGAAASYAHDNALHQRLLECHSQASEVVELQGCPTKILTDLDPNQAGGSST